MIFSAFAESISLASVIPFLTIISNPEMLFQMPFLKEVILFFNIQELENLRLLVLIFFVSAVFLSGVIRLFNIWISSMLSAAIGSDLSCNVYKSNLYQPYEYHLDTNSSKFITSAAIYINSTVTAISNFLQLISNIILSAAAISAVTVFGIILTL